MRFRTPTIFHTGSLLAALALYFRHFLLSGGKWVVGDTADGALILGIHEHWFQVLTGKAEWLNINFLYPVHNTLGYSDTFFLQGMIHSIFRLSGLDLYLSFNFTQMVLAVVGYLGMNCFLKATTPLSLSWRSLICFLFIIASPIYLITRNSHIQLLAIWILPWLALLLWNVWHNSLTDKRACRKHATLFFLLFSVLAYSTFYMAWFFGFFVILILLSALILSGPREVWESIRPRLSAWPSLVPGIIIAGLVFIPFAITYLNVKDSFGGRGYGQISNFLNPPQHLINHMEENLIWGKLSELINPGLGSYKWEDQLGISPLLAFLFFVSLALLIFSNSFLRDYKYRQFYQFLGLGVVIGMFFLLKFGPVSFWIIPYYLVPGADALRAVFRLMIVLFVPCLILSILGISSTSQKWDRKTKILFMVPLLVFLVIEQIQLVKNTNMDRVQGLDKLNQLPEPPEDATAFFTVGTAERPWNYHPVQNAAGLYAQAMGLPTINGRSGFLPKGWKLMDTRMNEAIPRLKDWINQHDIQGKVYLLNINTLKWDGHLTDGSLFLEYTLNQDIFANDQFGLHDHGGWSQPEPWGVWSNAKEAKLQFYLPTKPNDIYCTVTMNAFVNDKFPERSAKLYCNGVFLKELHFTTKNPEQQFTVELPDEIFKDSKQLIFTFEIPNPKSPKELGVGEDTRKLGIGLKSFVLKQY